MKITCLLENTAKRHDMHTEHGLSLYIESNGAKILFDMGQTDLFARNAATLGIDLTKVDTAILSHGHYDHGGGLEKFLEINTNSPVFVNKNAFGEHYNGTAKYIGLPDSLKASERLILCDDERRISDCLHLYTANALISEHEIMSGGLTVKRGDSFIPDSFRHEQYLLIEEQGKRVLISGCSHKGILNITEIFKPDVLIGGFHFSKLPLDTFLDETAEKLSTEKTVYYTCHCTGAEQYKYIKRHMDNLHYLSCGEEIII